MDPDYWDEDCGQTHAEGGNRAEGSGECVTVVRTHAPSPLQQLLSDTSLGPHLLVFQLLHS